MTEWYFYTQPIPFQQHWVFIGEAPLNTFSYTSLSPTLHFVLRYTQLSYTAFCPTLHLIGPRCTCPMLHFEIVYSHAMTIPAPLGAGILSDYYQKEGPFLIGPLIVVLLGRVIKIVIRAGSDPERDPLQQTKMKQTKNTISNAQKPFFMRLSIW